MKPIKVIKRESEEEQQREAFLRKFEEVSNCLKKNGILKLYDEKDSIIWINHKPKKGSKNINFYSFNNRDFSELNQLLGRIYLREKKLKEQGYNLDGIKSFNRNVWLSFSKNSNAIEGIFDDFEFDLMDLRTEIKGKLAVNKALEKQSLNDYFKSLLLLYQHAKSGNDSFIVTGKNKKHQLSIETVGQYLALKYAYKVAKTNLKQNLSDQERKDQFADLIFNVTSLLSGNEDVRFRNFYVYLQNSGAKWLPVNNDDICDKILALSDWVTCESLGKLHPLEKAAIFHAEFERIHPFSDGNGRTGRILTNYILMENEIPTISIGYKQRDRYFKCVNKAIEQHEVDDLVDLLYESVMDTAIKVDQCLDYIESKGKITESEGKVNSEISNEVIK